MQDTCPRFVGYILHRWPCPKAGEVENTNTPPENGGSDGDRA